MKTKSKLKIGIIGGSGLDKMSVVKSIEKKQVTTPYGSPSSHLAVGTLFNRTVVFLARHGLEHNIPPSAVPYKANMWALKQEGCDIILATTACGSLREEMKPGDLVFVDQFIDFTKMRSSTFFEDEVVHTPMADPFDFKLRSLLVKTARKLRLPHHALGTVVTIEGPRFSSRAESYMFQKLGADIINMSTMPEVALARELGIPYQSIAMVTDYDCWKENEISVTCELVMQRMAQNAKKVKQLLVETIGSL
ncbi:MAG: S-methyl-5'-thioadenosine phosphorylase [bacterium]